MTVQPGLPGFNIEAQAEMLAEFGTTPEGAGYKLPLTKVLKKKKQEELL